MAKIYQRWIDKSYIEDKYYQTVNTDISDDLEVKYKQNTYYVIYVETRGSRHDWKEDDDEESEYIEEDGLIWLFYMPPATFYNRI